MKIVFMGTPDFGRIVLEKLHEKYNVSLVVTQPDKKVGRRQEIVFSPVKDLAKKLNIELFQPYSIMDDYQKIIDLKPDLIITAAYGQMIPDVVLDVCPNLNVHGSLLPKRRGGAPVQRAIIEGDLTTGITLMYMAKQMDSGDIIAQREIAILDTDTTTTLMNKLAYVGADLLLENIDDIIAGTNKRIKQDEGQVTFSYNLTKEDEIISFNKPTHLVLRHLNGLLEEPGGSFYFNGLRIKVYKLEKSAIIRDKKPGTILSVNNTLTIKTSDGAVDVLEIQIPGKRKMNIKDFLNGQKIFNEGDVVK